MVCLLSWLSYWRLLSVADIPHSWHPFPPGVSMIASPSSLEFSREVLNLSHTPWPTRGSFELQWEPQCLYGCSLHICKSPGCRTPRLGTMQAAPEFLANYIQPMTLLDGQAFLWFSVKRFVKQICKCTSLSCHMGFFPILGMASRPFSFVPVKCT